MGKEGGLERLEDWVVCDDVKFIATSLSFVQGVCVASVKGLCAAIWLF